MCFCSLSDPSGLCWHWAYHDWEAPQPGEWHRVVLEESKHALLGHWLHQRGNARRRREEVPRHSHQGLTRMLFLPIETFIQDTNKYSLSFVIFHRCGILFSPFLWKCNKWLTTVNKMVLLILTVCVCLCVGPARPVRAEKREGQQGHYSVQHHVHCGPVSSLPQSTLEISEDCCKQAVWVHARWEMEWDQIKCIFVLNQNILSPTYQSFIHCDSLANASFILPCPHRDARWRAGHGMWHLHQDCSKV